MSGIGERVCGWTAYLVCCCREGRDNEGEAQECCVSETHGGFMEDQVYTRLRCVDFLSPQGQVSKLQELLPLYVHDGVRDFSADFPGVTLDSTFLDSRITTSV